MKKKNRVRIETIFEMRNKKLRKRKRQIEIRKMEKNELNLFDCQGNSISICERMGTIFGAAITAAHLIYCTAAISLSKPDNIRAKESFNRIQPDNIFSLVYRCLP